MKKLYYLMASFALVLGACSDDKPDNGGGDDDNNPPGGGGETATLVFGYCQPSIGETVGPDNPNSTLQAAIGIPATQSNQWKGNKITAVNIGFGDNSDLDITVFIANSLTGQRVYSQEATITQPGDWNKIELETPYEINGEEFYVGYEVYCEYSAAAGDQPIGMDYVQSNDPNSCWVSENGNWDSYNTSFGSICMQLDIEGDNLPLNDVMVGYFGLPDFVAVNQPFWVQFVVFNNGVKPVESLDFSVKINGVEAENPDITIVSDLPIVTGSYSWILIENIFSDVAGDEVPIEITVSKVNGKDDETPEDNSFLGTFQCAEKSYPRKMVVEEFTGTWCGWCPRGIVGMAYMEEKYGEDNFIGIAAHTGDAMEVESYSSVIDAFSQGSYPSAVANRAYYFDPSMETLEYYYNIITNAASPFDVKLTAQYSEAENVINATATINSVLDYENANYRFAFVITENNVGPYRQSNYFANGGGVLAGWDDKGSTVATLFNEVARDIFTGGGIPGSIPSNIVHDTEYTYSYQLSCENVKDINECKVIVMVLDYDNYYEVKNGAKVSLAGQGPVVTE